MNDQTRGPRNPVERHMMYVWWLRFLAYATGYDEDMLAFYANGLEHAKSARKEQEQAIEWARWMKAAGWDFGENPEAEETQ